MPQGTGSGFIWDERGHVVTNFHVIQGAQDGARDARRQQQLSGVARRREPGPRHRGAHDRRAGEAPLRAVPIGTCADLQVGQKVFAIGNPFGLDQTLTTGIICALDRAIDDERGGGSTT